MSRLATMITLAVSMPVMAASAGDETCERELEESFARGAAGSLYERATLVTLSGFPRLKLVSDFQPSTWGTWISPSIDETVLEFTASFRYSLKNFQGGPGDGFSFCFGDLSNVRGTRPSGGEWGIEAFLADGGGLSIGFVTYPGAGGNGVNGRWGGTDFAFTSFDHSRMRYDDDQFAGDPNNMATAVVHWSRQSGTTVTIAKPTFPPETIFIDQGQPQTASVDPTGWSFAFAGRNGGIDQDVLIGDLSISMVVECPAEENPADLNDDDMIDGADLGLLLGAWGPCTEEPCVGDINGDGVVNGADLGLLLLSLIHISEPTRPY